VNINPQAQVADRLKKLDALLNSGVSLEEAAQKLNPKLADQREVLRPLAFARQFHRDVVELLTRRLKKPQTLGVDEILATPGIEMVAQEIPEVSSAIYRVKDVLVGELLTEWVQRDSSRSDIRAVAKELSQLLRSSKRVTPEERLKYQIASASNSTEQREAEAAFDVAFNAANERPDLAQCHALVRMLIDLDNFVVGGVTVPLRLLSQDLKRKCDELLPYVAIRGRFIEEHFRSAQYQQREALWKRVKPFLDGQDGWVMSIFGTGGRGKTMFMQWLIARYCVLREQTIPVGRVDFDDINPGKLEEDPELILLPLAEQLNRQLPNAPLQDIVDRWGRFAVILTPTARIPRGLSVDGLLQQYRSLVTPQVLIETFAFKVSVAKSVVVLLDTLEDALLHQPKALQRVIELCRAVHRAQPPQSPALRIILSGRYNLRERKFLTAEDPEPVEVTPFEYEECVLYLTSKRRIDAKDKDGMIRAIARKSDGNPFILSLVADLVEDGSVKTVEEVDDLKPEFAYLLDRVIRRIPDSQSAVRWVIRYGVIPDRLTEDFLEKVMQSHLRRELGGDQQTQDTLAQYAHYFPRGGTLDAQTLWRDLSAYASDYSWVKATTDEIRFQPEVVVPMLALLAEEEGVYTLLHKDAERYFREKAEHEPESWVAWMAEAVYHKLQVGDADAELAFRALLDDSRAPSLKDRRHVLNVITRPRFVDEEGNLRKGKNQEPIVDGRVVGWAYLELARMGAGIGFGPCRLVDPESTVLGWLTRSRTLFGEPFFHVDTLVRMSVAASNGRYEEVESLGKGLTGRDLGGPEERYACRILLSRAAANRNTPESINDALYQLDEAEKLLPPGHSARVTLSEERAALLASTGRHAETVSAYEQTVHMASSDGQIQNLCRLAELHLDRAEYQRVVTLLLNLEAPGLFETPDGLRLVRTQTLAALDRREVLDELEGEFEAARDSAEVFEARGVWLLSSYRLASGIDELERAVALYRARGDMAAMAKALLRLIKARIDLVDDRSRAAQSLPDPALIEPDLLPLFALEVAHLQQRLPEVVAWQVPDGWASPAISLLHEPGSDQTVVRLRALADSFSHLEPLSLRYQSLRFCRWLEPLGTTADDLLTCVPPPDPDDPDFFAHAIPYVDFLRVCADEKRAKSMMVTTLRAVAGHRHTAGCDLLRLSRKLGMTVPAWDTLGTPSGMLEVAVNVEYIRSLIDTGEIKDATEWLSSIPQEWPVELARSQVEVTHLENRARLMQGRRASVALSEQAMEIRRQLGHSEGKAEVQPESPESQTEGVSSVTLGEIAEPWFMPATREIATFEMVKGLIEPEEVVRVKMAHVLPDHLSGEEIRLIVDQTKATSILPWEWALDEPSLCYRTTASSKGSETLSTIFWPRLTERMRRTITYLNPIRVLIAQPTFAQQERRKRGFERTSRRTLVDIYTSHGLKATVAEAANEAITDTIRRGMEGEEAARVLHLQCPLGESYRQLYLELGSTDGSGLTLETLIGLLPASDKTRPPTVILDPPRPADDLETARQLLLRNRFALDLYATGRVRAVLCTGLFEPSNVQLCAERLAHTMSTNPPLRDLLTFVQRDLDGDRFATRGAALFVDNPKAALA